MQLTRLLLMLKARLRIVLITFFITVLTAAAVSVALPKVYKATTQIVLNYKGIDSVTGDIIPAQQTAGYLATQVDIIKNRRLAFQVIDDLQLEQNPTLQEVYREDTDGRGQLRSWLAGYLGKHLDVSPAQESSVLHITFSSMDPQLSADVANAFATAYRRLVTELKVQPAQEAAEYFSDQVATLRAGLEKAQTRLSAYQQEKGITSVDERVDVENSRLNELSQQLVIAQALAIEARSRQSNAQSNAQNSPDVAQNPVIQSLRADAARASAKFAELSERLDVNHPQYQAARAELSKIQAQLQAEISRTSSSISSSASIQQQREQALREQVAIQKARVLQLNRTRDELAVLQKDVEGAQKALDAVTQRFSQSNIVGQSSQSDISILNPAEAPGMPDSPKVPLIILLALFLGAILGIGFGLFAELLDRRVRSTDDLSELLKVPVLGLIQNKPSVSGLRLAPPAQGGRFLP